MKILNPIQVNDWGFMSFSLYVIFFQLAFWCAIVLEYTKFEVLFLRQFVGMMNLIIIPGLLLLRIFRIHNIGNIKTLLFSIGLSISITMFGGFMLNSVLPLYGVFNPINESVIFVFYNAIILILLIIVYFRDKEFNDPSYININLINIKLLLFLLLLPFLAFFSIYLFNYYDINIFVLLLIFLISSMSMLVCFNLIKHNTFGIIIFLISFCLLFHRTLVSCNLWGYDIHVEYYFSNLVINSGYWNLRYVNNVNNMLSIAILAPLISLFCNISLMWVFKIIYPFVFAFMPLGIFYIYSKITTNKLAFLSTFFFMSVSAFFFELLQLARQQIAELYLVLLLIVIIDYSSKSKKGYLLYLIFSMSLVVSHYGVTYYLLFNLVLINILIFILIHLDYEKFKYQSRNFMPIKYIIIFILFTLLWYMYMLNSISFRSFINISYNILIEMYNFLDPSAVQGLSLITKQLYSPVYRILRILHLINQFFIFLGVISTILNKNLKNKMQYFTLFALINLFIDIAGLTIPNFSNSISTIRLYHFTLFFLSPFCVFGGILFIDNVSKFIPNKNVNSLKLLSIFYAIFLLFTSGFINEIVGDVPLSISLSKDIDYPIFSCMELRSAKWLSNLKSDDDRLYADSIGYLLLYQTDYGDVSRYLSTMKKIQNNSCVFFRSKNIQGITADIDLTGKISKVVNNNLNNSTFYNSVIVNKNKIYSNLGSSIFR